MNQSEPPQESNIDTQASVSKLVLTEPPSNERVQAVLARLQQLQDDAELNWSWYNKNLHINKGLHWAVTLGTILCSAFIPLLSGWAPYSQGWKIHNWILILSCSIAALTGISNLFRFSVLMQEFDLAGEEFEDIIRDCSNSMTEIKVEQDIEKQVEIGRRAIASITRDMDTINRRVSKATRITRDKTGKGTGLAGSPHI